MAQIPRECNDADTKNIIVNTCTECILEKANFSGKYNFLAFEKCAEHKL